MRTLDILRIAIADQPRSLKIECKPTTMKLRLAQEGISWNG